MSRNRSKYVHDEHCLSLTHDGECDCPRPRTLRPSVVLEADEQRLGPDGSTMTPVTLAWAIWDLDA